MKHQPSLGPRRRVDVASQMVDGEVWTCSLECGHTVTRSVWIWDDGLTHGDITQLPAPTWVYCEKCAERKGK
jgi:hypothetical protein